MTNNTKELSLKFKGKNLQWNSKIITYGEYTVRFENVKVVRGDNVFIQDPHNSIFATKDLTDFIFIGTGDIQTSFENSIVVEAQDHYWIYNNGMKILLYFYIENDKLVYYHTKRHDLSKTNVRMISYGNLLVAVSAMNALFIGMNNSMDIQFKFFSAVIDFNLIKNNGIEFLLFEYNKHHEHRFALFYQNVLLSSDVSLDVTSSHPNILFTPRATDDKRATFKEINSLEKMNEHSNMVGYDDLKNQYFGNDAVSEPNNIRNTQESFKRKERCVFQMDKLQRKAFKLASANSKILFLKSVFAGERHDIVSENLILLIHSSKNISSIFLKDQQESLHSLNELCGKSFFYTDPCEALNRKQARMKFRGKLSEDEEQFLARKYDRLFQYIKDIKNSRNLAYKIIAKEREYKYTMDSKALFKQMISYNKTFINIVHTYIGDTRMGDVIQILMEDSITMYPEIYDTNNFRQKTFLVRICTGIGAYLLNYRARYYHSIYRTPPKLNSTSLNEKINRNMAFLNAATYSSYFKIPAAGDIYEELGHAFGNGLLFGIDNVKLQKYVNMTSSTSDSVLKFIFLVISTYNTPRNNTINTILKSGLESNNIELMIASMCSLAIYNSNSHDRLIIEALEKELSKYGPVNAERTNVFYSQEYRKIAAICIGLISERPILSNYKDTFCELIIAGLSSIGKCPCPDIFFRTDECRPVEIFYSVLFGLTSDFSVSPESILDEFVIPVSSLDFYKQAAKIFYISLYYFYNNIVCDSRVYEKIFNLVLEIENLPEKSKFSAVLFNFSLVSLSIMKIGTLDLGLLRVLRRQILKSKEVKSMLEYTIYDPKKKEFVSFKGCSMESMQMYKTCLGILCLDFGISRVNSKFIKNLIVSFFLTEDHSLDFHFIDVLRMSIVRCICEDPKADQKLNDVAADLQLKIARKKTMKDFHEKFEKMDDIDRKIVIDILSDYYENHHFRNNMSQADFSNPKTIFDIKTLLNLLLVTK